jgi:hypothetical protein
MGQFKGWVSLALAALRPNSGWPIFSARSIFGWKRREYGPADVFCGGILFGQSIFAAGFVKHLSRGMKSIHYGFFPQARVQRSLTADDALAKMPSITTTSRGLADVSVSFDIPLKRNPIQWAKHVTGNPRFSKNAKARPSEPGRAIQECKAFQAGAPSWITFLISDRN